MAGITDLEQLLAQLNPQLREGVYVFCTRPTLPQALLEEAVGCFREAEGWTLILPEAAARQGELAYSLRCAWITLQVHSDLAAVGLTAAVAMALAAANLPANVVAAFYHDHLFVPAERAQEALAVLRQRFPGAIDPGG